MELGEPGEDGRRQPIPIDGSQFEIELDAVVPAIGQESDWACLTPECACTLTDWNTLNVDSLTLQTEDPDIFAGGDAITGAKTVIEAIEAGKQAAISMDRYIRGVDLREGRKKEWETVLNVSIEDHDSLSRTSMPRLEPKGRLNNFKEVQQGFSEEQVVAEAKRCLSCECSDCHHCVEVCPGKNLPYSEMEQMIFGRTRNKDSNEKMFGVHKYHIVTHSVSEEMNRTGVAGASVSTLLIHGLETGFLDAAIVAGYDKQKPWQVRPYVVTDREDVLAAARSKYGVCSINTLLAEAAEKYEKIAVVACPCHVMGIRKMALRKLNPKITDRIKLIVGLYCLAQNFSLAAEYMITQRMHTKLEDVAAFQYRGGAEFGGGTWVKKKDGEERQMELLGNWGMVPTVFIGYQMERCYVCQDHVADLADISCGDVWGRHMELEEKSNMGWTGIFVRTPVGEEIIESAVKAGVLYTERDDTISDYYCVNPGHSKKFFANPRRIEYRKRYGWSVPEIT